MKKPIYLIGAGGLGREVRALIARLPAWQLEGFYDDAVPAGSSVEGVSCLGTLSQLLNETPQTKDVVIAVGDPGIKRGIMERVTGARHLRFPVLIDPAAILLDPETIQLGTGTILTAGCTLTTGIAIGKHCLINLNVTIGHGTRIGDGCSVMPGVNVAGNVTLEKDVFVGSGANILNGVEVGKGARIGAGAVVLSNVAEGSTVMGVPAKEKK